MALLVLYSRYCSYDALCMFRKASFVIVQIVADKPLVFKQLQNVLFSVVIESLDVGFTNGASQLEFSFSHKGGGTRVPASFSTMGTAHVGAEGWQ